MEMGKGFNILPSNELAHQKKQFGMGILDLNSLSSVLIDPDNHVFVDMGALHAKSEVERGIRFSPDKETVPGGKPYWVVWVAMERNDQGPAIVGLTASEMWIDRENRKGWKVLPDHVNAMDKALKRRFHLYHMPEDKKRALRDFLQSVHPQAWENSCDDLKALFETGENTAEDTDK